MATNHEQVECFVGRINTDILSGWEAGLKGKERIAGRLWERQAPTHITGRRHDDWIDGRNGAARLLATRLTIFTGKTLGGQSVMVKRKGWVSSDQRWKVVYRMKETQGVIGDVYVAYMESGEIAREHNCGT